MFLMRLFTLILCFSFITVQAKPGPKLDRGQMLFITAMLCFMTAGCSVMAAGSAKILTKIADYFDSSIPYGDFIYKGTLVCSAALASCGLVLGLAAGHAWHYDRECEATKIEKFFEEKTPSNLDTPQ